LIVDVHDFPPRRRHLLARQLIYCHDAFLDVPTHPAAQHPALGQEGTRLLQPILSALDAAGYRSARYTRVTEKGRVRHSTPDVVGQSGAVALPGPFTPQLEARWRVNLPRAYAVPRTLHALLEVLGRHGFALETSARNRIGIERYWIEGLKPPKRPNGSPRKLSLRVDAEDRPLNDYVLVPVTTDSGAALAVFLEPASKYGLARFPEMSLPLTPRS